MVISSINSDGLLATSGLEVGMQVLTVNNMPVEDEITCSSSIGSERSNHYTIPVCREEARIHHSELEMISYINEKLSLLNVISGANPLQFNMNNKGHFYAPMDYQSHKQAMECLDDILGFSMMWSFRAVVVLLLWH